MKVETEQPDRYEQYKREIAVESIQILTEILQQCQNPKVELNAKLNKVLQSYIPANAGERSNFLMECGVEATHTQTIDLNGPQILASMRVLSSLGVDKDLMKSFIDGLIRYIEAHYIR